MKLTTVTIKRLVKEELTRFMNEVTYDQNPLAGGASPETIRKAISGPNNTSKLLINYTTIEDDQEEAEQIKAISDELQANAQLFRSMAEREKNKTIGKKKYGDAASFAAILAQSLANLADGNDKGKLARAKTQIFNIKAKAGIEFKDKPSKFVMTDDKPAIATMKKLLASSAAPKSLDAEGWDSFPLLSGLYILGNKKLRDQWQKENGKKLPEFGYVEILKAVEARSMGDLEEFNKAIDKFDFHKMEKLLGSNVKDKFEEIFGGVYQESKRRRIVKRRKK